MMAGSTAMQFNAGVPYPLVNVLQGLIILSITATFVINRRTREHMLRLLPFLRRWFPAAAPAGTAAQVEEPQETEPAATTAFSAPGVTGTAAPPTRTAERPGGHDENGAR